MVALISGHRDVSTACFYELASSSEMSAKIVHLLSDVMGFPKVFKRECARCKQCRNEDRSRRLCGKYTARCRNECHQFPAMHEQVGSCSGAHIISKLVDFPGCNEFHKKRVSSQKANAAVVFP